METEEWGQSYLYHTTIESKSSCHGGRDYTAQIVVVHQTDKGTFYPERKDMVSVQVNDSDVDDNDGGRMMMMMMMFIYLTLNLSF